MKRWFVVACLVGCGRLHFDAVGADAAVVPDAPFATGPFGPPTLVTALSSSGSDDDPSMTGDMLELYFASTRSGSEQAFVTTRETTSDPWSTPVLVTELNAGGFVNNTRVTTDGLAVYFSTNRAPNAGGTDLWFSTRIDRTSPWQPPQRVDDLATSADEFEPTVDRARLTMYFTTTATSPTSDLWRSTRASTSDPWGTAAPVAELVSPSGDSGCWADDAGLHVAFHSNRSGTRVLYEAVRTSTSEPFGSINPIPGIDTAATEQDAWMSADGHVLMFASDAAGSVDIYIATR